MKISGTFEVAMTPQDTSLVGENGLNLNRMSFDKTFDGELSAQSHGEMLSVMTSVKGSAGYVAIEQVTGQLCGKKGSFALQHFGTMQQSSDFLLLEVIPDSGCDELEGLSGKMTITIEEGQHYYTFEYQIT